MSAKTYICAACSKPIPADDETETLLEMAQLLTTAPAEDCQFLCDDCGKALLAAGN